MTFATADLVRSVEAPLPADLAVAGHSAAEGLLSPERQRRLIGWFLALGALARCVRYFLNFPLWEDECFLCVNFIDRGYRELLEPLQYHQVAPPLFLWVELSVVKLLGFSEWSLRLFPFLCSLASLFLFRHLAGRMVRGLALVLAVATFSVAYPGIRYAAEAKQYASDLFVSLALLSLAVAWRRSGNRSRWLWGLSACAPIAVGLSYPATFVAGGISLFAAAVLVRQRAAWREWLPWAGFNAALLAGFAAVFLVAAKGQSHAELDFMNQFWREAFPPWRTPLRLPGWLLVTHASDLLAYPAGGARGASALTFLGFAAGIGLLARRRQWAWLLLALAPFAVHLAAAALERYPYGGHVKFSQHLAPSICLLAGLGGTVWVGLLRGRATSDEFGMWSSECGVAGGSPTSHSALRTPHSALASFETRHIPSRALLAGTLLLPAVVGAASIARDVWRPYKTQSDVRARAFARWFWFNAQSEGEVLCLKTDLDRDFSPDADRRLSWTAMYLCNQRIYSPRHRAGAPPRLADLSPSRPLRCVLYRDPKCDFDEQAFADWLAEQQARYELVGSETYPFPRYDKREERIVTVDYLDEFKFVPRERSPSKISAAGDDRS
ncbi:MAG: glycosyltransferase family 39 protein [Planctomycetales bacterium]